MKINFHYHFYSKIFISLLIFSFGFFLLQKSVDTKALITNVYQDDTPIVGWAWNDKMGWIALNCANDFDGDGDIDGGRNPDGTGWGSCAVMIDSVATQWGLKMAVDNVDHDNDASTPNIDMSYVRGCAWAGNIADPSPAGSAPGWICFSDTANNTTDAPPLGVAMSQSASSYSTCSCQMITGVCEGPIANNLCINDGIKSYCSMDLSDKCVTDPDGTKHCSVDRNDQCLTRADGSKYCQLDPGDSCVVNSDCISSCNVDSDCLSLCSDDTDCHVINSHYNCTNFGQCSGINLSQVSNYCQADHTCSKSKNDCSQRGDEDCQFACVSPDPVDPGPAFLLNGVCFDYSTDTQAQRDILNGLRGQVPPFNTGDPYLHSCYINKDCYDVSLNPNNAGHPNGECVYPQYGDSVNGGGAGRCMVDSATPQANGATCVYDFDCDIDAGNYCALALNATIPNAPTSCTSPMCVGGYEAVTRVVTENSYVNALSSSPLASDGFASILRMEPLAAMSAYSGANRLGFPVQSKVEQSAFPSTDPKYDIDNPNNRATGDNPIRGCFNCYREKKYSCLSGSSCTCDQKDNSCNDASCVASSDGSDYCSVYSLGPAICENCQEYFYYTADQSTCSIRTDRACSASDPCPDGFGDCQFHKNGDLQKVLTGFNCTECTVDDFTNSCSLNASNINSNSCKRCETKTGATFDSNVYRIGGVLYDNQHGRSSTSTLCGWGYNSWSGSDGSIGGFGWFNFSPRISTSTKPYFSVAKGNIYAKGRIGTTYQPPINRYNASYLIESSGSIKNFVSGASKNSDPSLPSFKGELPNRPIIDFLSPVTTGKYQNALGKLDYKGLITTARTNGALKYNKYGSQINTLTQAQFENTVAAIFANPLDNQVFYVERDNNATYVQISDSVPNLEVKVGDNTRSGSGIIVVNGTLKIEKNITYESSSAITNLKQIPSLVWIIKGDVEIDSDVDELVGTFIILGRDGLQDCSMVNPNGRSTQHCGQFSSVHYDASQNFYTGLANAGFLKIYGNVLARKFFLVRNKVDSITGAPAEEFINDGRLQSNPPLGLIDFSRVIPRFSSY